MSDRFAHLFQPADKFDLLALLDDWASKGVSLKNPATIELDWDRLSVIGKYEDRICPDILAVHQDRAVDFMSCLEGDRYLVRFGQYVIVKRITVFTSLVR